MSSDKAPVIGLLIGQLEESYLSLIWPGIVDYAKENGLNLIIFSARSPASDYGWDYEHNVVNDFITNKILDGIIIITGEMGDYMSSEEIQKFCDNFSPLPLISVGYPIKNNPNILIDNKPAVKDSVHHLVNIHHKRRIAFIKGSEGNPDSEERYEAYCEALEELEIKHDPQLVYQGNFLRSSGIEAVKTLLDERQTDFEAIIAADDMMALGAMEELNKRNLRVPENIALIGFDNIKEAKYNRIPLTTVDQPLYHLGWTAGEVLHSVIQGKEVQQNIMLPTRLKIRQSCGCLPSIHQKSRSFKAMKVPQGDISTILNTDFSTYLTDRFLEELTYPEYKEKKLRSECNKLFSYLFKEFTEDNTHNAFLKQLNFIISQCADIDILSIQTSLMLTFRILSWKLQTPEQHQKLDYFIQNSETLILDTLIREQSMEKLHQTEQRWLATEVLRDISVAFGLGELIDIMYDEVPRLGISEFYLALYKGENIKYVQESWQMPEESELIVAYNENGLYVPDESNRYFETRKLLPGECSLSGSGKTFMVLPLFFIHDQFGYLIISFDTPEVIIYENLRTQVSSALKGAILLRERIEAEEVLKEAFIKIENANMRLHDLSMKDDMTGLYNRRGFMNAGRKLYKTSQASGESFILFFIDLDGLKIINDTMGHEYGDIAIIETSKILKRTFRGNDIAARLGGDEFTVITLDAEKRDVKAIITRVNHFIKEYNKTSEYDFTLSLSLGYSIFTKGCKQSFEELMSDADKNLYIEKKKKK